MARRQIPAYPCVWSDPNSPLAFVSSAQWMNIVIDNKGTATTHLWGHRWARNRAGRLCMYIHQIHIRSLYKEYRSNSNSLLLCGSPETKMDIWLSNIKVHYAAPVWFLIIFLIEVFIIIIILFHFKRSSFSFCLLLQNMTQVLSSPIMYVAEESSCQPHRIISRGTEW